MNAKDIIIKRKSVRTYLNTPIDPELKKKISNYADNLKMSFEAKTRFPIIDIDNKDIGVKLGTYGVIKGASTFMCAVVEKGDRCEIGIGYAFEKLILYATSLGLGTCWLAGTFKRSGFEKAANLKGGEEMPVICPVGYADENRSLIDRFMVMAAGSKNRKDWNELFFNKSFNDQLDQKDAGLFKNALEMVRLAPSSSNRQPWRVVKDGKNFYFYICRNKGYAKATGFDIQMLDMGIAMCHFEAALSDEGIKGSWREEKPDSINSGDNDYVISFHVG